MARISPVGTILLARFPNRVRDAAHGLMHRQTLRLPVLHQPEDRAAGAHDDAQIHQRQAAQAAQAVELHLFEAGDFQVGFASLQAAVEAQRAAAMRPRERRVLSA